MNKTLMKMAIRILSAVRLGQEFWVEAVETACYLVNRSPSSALEDKTPQEVWTGKKPYLSHLRVFGCDAYVHVPKEKQAKLDSKSEKCIFIRYKDGLKGYNIWNSVTRKNCEAVDSEDGKLWKEVMVDEMASLHKNEAWDLVELSVGRKPIGSKRVFKKKTNVEGKEEKYKARLVEKGYSQVTGIDFGDIFSPIANVASIRLLLSVFVAFDFEVEHMDVKTTFLHGDLEEEIYMKQPEGFVVKGVKLSIEQCHKTQEEEEDMSYVPYASAVGSMMYAMVCTRPYIAHAVGVLSRFMSTPRKEHWTTVKRVFRYLHGTSDYGLCYQGRPRLDGVLDICGFLDAELAGDLDQRRFTSGYVFNLFGGAVSWMSRKQSVVALPTTKEEYMAVTHASKETIWL
eukprot:PITA_14841